MLGDDRMLDDAWTAGGNAPRGDAGESGAGEHGGASQMSGAEFIRHFLPDSPFVGHLGIQLSDLQPDVATLTLPFAQSLATVGSIVHGGAIATLIDTAAMVAAWSGAEPDLSRRGGAQRVWNPAGQRARHLQIGVKKAQLANDI